MFQLSSIRSKTLVTLAFTLCLSILAVFILLWATTTPHYKSLVSQNAALQQNQQALLTHHYIVTQRFALLEKLAAAQSNAEKMAAYTQYNALDYLYTPGSNTKQSGVFSPTEERDHADDSRAAKLAQEILTYRTSVKSQTDAFEAQASTVSDAQRFEQFLGSALSLHKDTAQLLENTISNDVLLNSKVAIQKNLEQIDNTHAIADNYIALLSICGLLLAMFSYFVVTHTGRTEDALMEQGKRIRSLYEITTRSDLTLDEQIDLTLELGRRLLGADIGKLGRQDPDHNESHFLNTVAIPDIPAKRGIVLPLDKTFCNITFSSDGPIAINHVAKSKYKDHPAASFIGMQSYIGTTVRIHGKKFGTVNFSNRQPRKTPFTQTDMDLVNLIGSWISVSLEKQYAEEALRQSKRDADTANKAKSEFLANMSHEIRTPLTAILGYSEMLRDEDQTQADFTHEIDSIIKGGHHLQSIINDILDLSKIEAGQLVIENLEVEPVRLLLDLESIMGANARDKGLAFELEYHYPFPGKIISDPTRLKQILFNLCGNAIKFTREGSVRISLEYLQQNQQMKFSIQDTGIGMSPDAMQRIFKPFSQADTSTTRKFGGTGLGLCISKQLAQNLGGDIEVNSEPDKGSCFVVVVDTGNVDAIADQQWIRSADDIHIDIAQDNHGFRVEPLYGHVLLAEDCPSNQHLISTYLLKAGASVEIVENGLQALQRATTGHYDLVLIDIQMPVMDGLTAIRKLREAGFRRPIVTITANAMKEDKDKALAVGANDYLTKPVDVVKFYAVLKEYLPEPDSNISAAC